MMYRPPVRIEDVEEFALASRIPRPAITTDVLAGVRQLHETKQLEPFLRRVLADHTDTPHTSTEIADILTPHVTLYGVPVLAAFVNKGRATPKVTAREVAHQITRLRQVQGVGLLVLLAVGDIYDDAVSVLTQTASDAGAAYLIVDATDVARLLIAYQLICPQDGTAFGVDGKCPACGTPADQPVELTFKVFEPLRRVILSHQDVSIGAQKRYRAEILTDPHYGRAVLRQVVKAVVWELCRSRYYRSGRVEAFHGDRDADLVLLFIYVDAADRQMTNWVCRAQWVSPALSAADNRGMRLGDDTERVGDIEIDWSRNYDILRSFSECAPKEVWVRKVERVLPLAEKLIMRARGLLAEFETGRLDSDGLQAAMEPLETEAGRVFGLSGNEKLPPLECAGCDLAFRCMIGNLHNVFLPFATWGQGPTRTTENKLWMLRSHLGHYENDKAKFEHEWHKLGHK